MKKERIVALCISAVLLGTLYVQWVSWACHLAIPSMAQIIQKQGSAAKFVAACWPPVGVVYSEVQFWKQKSVELRARQGSRQEPVGYLNLQSLKKGR